ncbi:MAG: 3-oxoacyl-ACP reductase FabG [Clostridia bacterium]|nr:3-oxoacyl-ACP reductase FabG [Clostridia bacterium]
MKNVLVTGGSRGIGRAIVKAFSEKGYNVAFTYKSSHEEALSLSKETGALSINADSASSEAVLSAVKKAEDRIGKIDILINNAAVSSTNLFTDISLDEWNEELNVNLTAAFLYTREVSRGMISRKWGRIINISSMWGVVGASCEVCYSTAKAALIGMTKALAKELGPSGITVNAIAPGLIDTDMNNHLTEEDKNELIDMTPVSRIGTPRDVSAATLFLAGDDASFITGEVLNLSGGFVIY